MKKLFFFNNGFEVCFERWYNYYLMPLFRNVKSYNTQKLERMASGIQEAGPLFTCFTAVQN